MKLLMSVASVLLAGCAATPESLESVARTESARMPAPSRPFSSFADYEFKFMTLSPAVLKEPGKVEKAGELDATMRRKLEPLFEEWRSAPPDATRSGQLVVEPQLASFKVVSEGTRFLAGGRSIGKSDQKLLDYIAAVSYQNLRDHY